jgi:hypothetical protein
MAAVLKTVVPKGTGGSNPSLSATIMKLIPLVLYIVGSLSFLAGSVVSLYQAVRTDSMKTVVVSFILVVLAWLAVYGTIGYVIVHFISKYW